MSNPMRKSNEGFRPRQDAVHHRVVVDMWIPNNPGEIDILRRASNSLAVLAAHGYMPYFVESITREVLDTDE